MTFHPRGRTTSSTWFNAAPWLDFNMFQSGHRRYGQRFGDGDYPIEENTEEDNWRFVERSMATNPMKPVIDGEPIYEEIPHGLHDENELRWKDYDVRRYAYWSVLPVLLDIPMVIIPSCNSLNRVLAVHTVQKNPGTML